MTVTSHPRFGSGAVEATSASAAHAPVLRGRRLVTDGEAAQHRPLLLVVSSGRKSPESVIGYLSPNTDCRQILDSNAGPIGAQFKRWSGCDLRIQQLSNLELDVMAAVFKRPDGADNASILDAFATASATGRPSLSAICNTLDRLERKHLVSLGQSEGVSDGPADRSGRKDRRYVLTASGLDLLRRRMPTRRDLPRN